ncbi:hypothetical protein [Devosia ureilytica]|nr:hypothetical protein [Devosia ureilytica]
MAAKLRENLKRRKDQAKARAQDHNPGPEPDPGPEAPEMDTDN